MLVARLRSRAVLRGVGEGVICPRAPQLGKIKGRLELEKPLLPISYW